jgi:RNA-dependent RNA polymerase
MSKPSKSPSGSGSGGDENVVRSMDVPSKTLQVKDARCVEIVEEEGDLEPTALDKLNEILGL